MLKALSAIEVIQVVDTANDAVDWLSRNQCDVALIDISLRQGSGLQVLEYLLQHPEAVRHVVVVTNNSNALMRQRCQRLGATVLFDKGQELDGLFAWLAALPR